jgi:release factor glutamine methyltransferase
MRLLTLPGVFRPRPDSWLLLRALRAERLPPGARVLDVCTGSGLLAVGAAMDGARATAIDVSRRAVLCAALNARLNGVRVRALRGHLVEPVRGERFDAIVSNPPYLPAEHDELPAHGPARAWDAGRDGRALLDALCAQAPGLLAPGGVLLLLHSDLCGTGRTLAALRAQGLHAEPVVRHRGPLGPLLGARAAMLEARGLLAVGQRDEETVIVRSSDRALEDSARGQSRDRRPARGVRRAAGAG